MVDLYDTHAPAYDLNGTDYGDGIFAKRAHDIITAHALDDPSVPLFLYYAFQINHNPLEAPYEYWERFSAIENEKRRNYTAMTPYMDDKLHNLTSLLEATGMWDDTLLIWFSDNGGPSGADCDSGE